MSPRVERILQWHGDRCHICGLPMRLGRRAALPLRVSKDHLVPRSEGGTERLTNILLAHQMCNCLRGNQPITDALRDACAQRVRRMQGRAS